MTAAAEPMPTAAAEKGSSLWRDTLRDILRQRSAIVGLAIISLIVLVAILAPVIAPFDPTLAVSNMGEVGSKVRQAPCVHLLGCPLTQPEHLMGLDGNGRDVFSRILFGTQISFMIGFVTVGLAIVVGSVVGTLAGFFGGVVDNVLMRLMDVFLAFPALLLAISIVTVLGQGLFQATLAVAIVSIPVYARVMRASVLSIRENDYVTASRAMGESSMGMLMRRVLPNALTPLIVRGSLGIGGAIIEVAALSFLGMGSQPPTPDWGSMIGDERNAVFSAPHLIFFPGGAIVLMVLAFNLLGDGIRDALDPRLNR
jgi:peptide/nickel transport system permease protein